MMTLDQLLACYTTLNSRVAALETAQIAQQEAFAVLAKELADLYDEVRGQ